MEASEQDAGIARSGRDHKCPHCEANNRADARWCWQCLERFPEPEPEPSEPEPSEPEPSEPEPSEPAEENAPPAAMKPATLRPDAMSELAGIGGAEDVAARLASLLADEVQEASVTDGANGSENGASNGHASAAVLKEPEVEEVEAVIEGEKGAIEIKGREITWTCSRCESVNGFDRNICEVCGATFAEVLKEPDEERPRREPNTVAMVSMFFPGAGHAYLGMWGQAVARGVISMWVVATAIFAAAQGAAQSLIMAVVFGLMSFGLWGVSVHDAYREAQGQKSAVLLRDKLFLYVVLGLLLLSVVMVFSLTIGARAG